MVKQVVLYDRFKMACSYLQCLKWSFSIEWKDAYKVALKEQSWLYRLALIHPDHYKGTRKYDSETLVQKACPIRGARQFNLEFGAAYLKCGANTLWGYSCPLHGSDQLVAGHHFPFSLGGPTLAENKVYLCHWHNQAKAGDIHIYPWDKGEPAWLAPTLERVKRLIA